MKPVFLTLLATLLLSVGEQALALPASDEALIKYQVARLAAQIKRRSNPTGSYAPSFGTCPTATGNKGFIRDARNYSVSNEEADYLSRHRSATQQAWATWLSSSPGPNLDGTNGIAGGVRNYTNMLSNLPKVGIALSGGGYRAMIHGTGYVSGLDGRNSTAKARGTAGFLQLASHIAGLSGGSWAVGSLALNDWPTIPDLATQTWNLSENLIIPADNKLSYYTSIVSQVGDKRDEDFPTGITDYWGRALSYHLVNITYPNEGEGTTFSDIRNTSNFASAAYPFPLVVSDEREADELLIYRNTTLFEFNPYEFGSWDPRVAAFVPIDILGTNLTNGTSTQMSGNCTFGFENFGWVVGTSSTLFNGLYNMLITSDGDGIIQSALEAILKDISGDENDVSVLPNPFTGWFSGEITSQVGNLDELTLVDGGEDNQNLPINNLLQPARDLDFILAVDSSADVTDWPNGTAIRETFLRYEESPQFDYIPMPDIPSENTFINRGLNTRPTFFGCDSSVNITNANTAANGTKAPIIAYVANYPWTYLSNTSTFQLEYEMSQVQQMFDNAVDVATLGGITSGSLYWPTCLACAALQRSFERSNTARPDVCTQCLDAYCWDGVTNDTTPSASYSPIVGTPEWITSNGTVQSAPASSGGNGSNAAEQTASGATDGAASIISLPILLALALTVCTFALLLNL